MTTEHIVFCDGCEKQLLPIEHVKRIHIEYDVNNGRKEADGMWLWERPMIRAEDPPGSDNFYSGTIHYCPDCWATGQYRGFLPTQFEEDCP